MKNLTKKLLMLLAFTGLIHCGGGGSSSTSNTSDDQQTPQLSPAQQAAKAAFQAESQDKIGFVVNGLMVNALTPSVADLIYQKALSAVSEARAQAVDGAAIETLPTQEALSSCAIIEEGIEIPFIDLPTAPETQVGTTVYGSRENRNGQLFIVSPNEDQHFCESTDGQLLDPDAASGRIENNANLFSSFSLDEQVYDCGGVTGRYVLSGTGVSRFSNVGLDNDEQKQILMVWGLFTITPEIDGEVVEEYGYDMNCTFGFSASGFFDPGATSCTLASDDNIIVTQTQGEEACEFVE